MIKVKSGVKPPLVILLAAAANAAEELGLTITVTSGSDGVHKQGSKHYSLAAIDVRSRGLSRAERNAWLANVRKRLGPGYDCIEESDHFHCEWDPK